MHQLALVDIAAEQTGGVFDCGSSQFHSSSFGADLWCHQWYPARSNMMRIHYDSLTRASAPRVLAQLLAEAVRTEAALQVQ